MLHHQIFHYRVLAFFILIKTCLLTGLCEQAGFFQEGLMNLHLRSSSVNAVNPSSVNALPCLSILWIELLHFLASKLQGSLIFFFVGDLPFLPVLQSCFAFIPEI